MVKRDARAAARVNAEVAAFRALDRSYDRWSIYAHRYEKLDAGMRRNAVRLLDGILLLTIASILYCYAYPWVGGAYGLCGVYGLGGSVSGMYGVYGLYSEEVIYLFSMVVVVVFAMRIAVTRVQKTPSTNLADAETCRKLAELSVCALPFESGTNTGRYANIKLRGVFMQHSLYMLRDAERLFAPRELR